jgi:lipoate-protein ligase B
MRAKAANGFACSHRRRAVKRPARLAALGASYNLGVHVEDLGTVPYRDAWALQEAAHAEVVGGAEERILLVEHPPVITFGRRPGVDRNIVATPERLESRGVEVVPSDRGGDVTFHGPGQLVAYPIVRLIDHALSVGGYVRALEHAVIQCLADLGVAARKDDCAVGVWVDEGRGRLAKVCAIGVRVRRGATLHGLALNVTTDLSFFDLIVPCGLVGRPVTSLQELLGDKSPPMERVKQVLGERLVAGLSGRVALPPGADRPKGSCVAPAAAVR